MKILILNGSPRPNGSTSAIVEAFAEGAEEAGHSVEIIKVGRKKIAGCLGCEYCHTKGNGQCIQKDDEKEVYKALEHAEMLVLASPIYYYSFSAQLQAALHRTYALKVPKKVRKTALLLSSGSPDVYGPAVRQYQLSVVEYYKIEDLGEMTVNEENYKAEDHLVEFKMFGRSVTE